MRILLVEDDRYTQHLLKTSLTNENFLVDVAEDGESAWEIIQQFPYDLVLLDVMLPRLDGISLCQRLRQSKNAIPVMLLTTRSSMPDKLMGLESGADDYLTKPFNMQELIARLRILARRNSATATGVLTCDRLCLDPISRQVTYDGRELKIGRKEYLILELLLRHPHQVFNRGDFIDRLWSLDQEIPTEATVKSHIRRIRRKLEEVGAADLIETLYGQGYRLNPALVDKPSVPPISDAKLEQVNQLTADVWQRAYAKTLEKIGELEHAIAQLHTDQINLATLAEAIFIAHKLAGSLHIFGFDIAAQLLQAIEDELRQENLSFAIAPQLQRWLEMVRLELAGQQSSITQIQTASLSASSPTRRLCIQAKS